jgi:hypothetical protein
MQGSKYVAKDRIRNEQQHRVTAIDLWNGLSIGFKGFSIRAEIKNDRWISKKPVGSMCLAQRSPQLDSPYIVAGSMSGSTP